MSIVSNELLSAAKEGVIHYDLLRELALDSAVSPVALLDSLGEFVATQYSGGAMTFDEADKIMNAAFGVSVTEDFWAENDRTIPYVMYEVYEAFDAGEYFHHGDARDVDLELKYTKPLIAQFLAAQRNDA